jgi:hypothetical protein
MWGFGATAAEAGEHQLIVAALTQDASTSSQRGEQVNSGLAKVGFRHLCGFSRSGLAGIAVT